jgi:hypothetical protein
MLLTKIGCIETINGLMCCHPSSLIDATEIKDFNDVVGIFSYFDQSCIISFYFHCNQSMKCIPYHRVSDGIDDCYFEENESLNACQINDSNKCLSQVVMKVLIVLYTVKNATCFIRRYTSLLSNLDMN